MGACRSIFIHVDYTFQMESGNRDVLGDAAAQLRSHDDVRAMVERRGPSRAYATLQLWGALVLGVYGAVFLIAFGGRTVDEIAAGESVGASTMLLLFPVIVFSGLLDSAKQRFSIRRKPSLGFWIAYGLIFGGFGALVVMITVSVTYPWWLNVLVPVALFVTMATAPIRVLLSATTTPVAERWGNEPLSRPTRWATVLIGAMAGVVVATSTQQWFSIVAIVIMLGLVVVMIAWASFAVLPRPGYEWGPIHWSAFGVTMSVLFLVALLLVRTTWITPVVTVIAGVFVFVVMLTASRLPLRPKQ